MKYLLLMIAKINLMSGRKMSHGDMIFFFLTLILMIWILKKHVRCEQTDVAGKTDLLLNGAKVDTVEFVWCHNYQGVNSEQEMVNVYHFFPLCHSLCYILLLLGSASCYICKKLGRSVIDIAKIVTILGDSLWYFIILVPAFIYFWFLAKNKLWSKRIIFILVSLSISGLLNLLIKWLAGRYRPNMLEKVFLGLIISAQVIT